MLGLRSVRYGIQTPNWIDSEYHNTEQICDVLIVLIHCKVVRCEYKGERRNTYVLFNLERSHDSIFIENREVVL